MGIVCVSPFALSCLKESDVVAVCLCRVNLHEHESEKKNSFLRLLLPLTAAGMTMRK